GEISRGLGKGRSRLEACGRYLERRQVGAALDRRGGPPIRPVLRSWRSIGPRINECRKPSGLGHDRAHRSRSGAMAGHSQFKNIMHRKGRQDAVRSKLFSKLAREITIAAKLGVPDPNMNPRLRAAILAARAENMPKDNIERAIKKSQGGEAETYEEIRYEGYGPGGVAMIVEVVTDNRNRTASD